MNQSRRDLLRALAVTGGMGVAGCSGLTTDEYALTDSPSPSGSPTSQVPTQSTSDHPLASTVTDTPDSSTPSTSTSVPPTNTSTVTDGPADMPFQFEAEAITAEPTTETPPVLRIQITNTDDQPHSLTTLNWTQPINPLFTEIGGQPMQLLESYEGVIFPEAEPPCWKSAVSPSSTGRNGTRFAAGESITGEYVILPTADEPEDISDCYPAGMGTFSQRYWLDPSQTGNLDGEEFTWVLEVRIDDTQAIAVSSTDTNWE